MSRKGQPMNKNFQIYNIFRMLASRNINVEELNIFIDEDLHLFENFDNIYRFQVNSELNTTQNYF